MDGDTLPDGDHVVRYCRPGTVDDSGLPMAHAFERRPREHAPSVNWLELLQAPDRSSAIREITKALRQKITVRPNGRLAVLNVDEVIRAVGEFHLSFVHRPEPNDPSHTEIYGYPEGDPEAELQLTGRLRMLVSADDVFVPPL